MKTFAEGHRKKKRKENKEDSCDEENTEKEKFDEENIRKLSSRSDCCVSVAGLCEARKLEKQTTLSSSTCIGK
jgi:hypothetical protein